MDAVTSVEEENSSNLNNLESNMQLVICNEEETWSIEEAEPLNYQPINEESDREMDASLWVHKNIIKMSKEFGVDFEGCKKEGLALFKKIDSKGH